MERFDTLDEVIQMGTRELDEGTTKDFGSEGVFDDRKDCPAKERSLTKRHKKRKRTNLSEKSDEGVNEELGSDERLEILIETPWID